MSNERYGVKLLRQVADGEKKLANMIYTDIDSIFEAVYGNQQLVDEKETSFRRSVDNITTDEDTKKYFQEKTQEIPHKKMVDVQTQLAEDDLTNSPQKAYFCILSLISGTYTTVTLKENSGIYYENEKILVGGDYEHPATEETRAVDKYHVEKTESLIIGEKPNVALAIQIRNEVAKNLTGDDAEMFNNHVNNMITLKVTGNSMEQLEKEFNNINNALDNINKINENTFEMINSFLGNCRKLNEVDKSIINGKHEILNNKIVSIKKNFENSLDKLIKNPGNRTLQDMKSILHQYQQLSHIMKFNVDVPNNIKIIQNAYEIKTKEQKIENLVTKGTSIKDEISNLYKQFQNDRKEFFAGKIPKEEFKQKQKKVENEVNKLLENSGKYVAEINALTSDTNSGFYSNAKLEKMSNELDNIGRFIEFNEKFVGAKLNIMKQIIPLLEKIPADKDAMKNNLSTDLKIEIKKLQEAKTEVDVNQALLNINKKLMQHFGITPSEDIKIMQPQDIKETPVELTHLNSLFEEYAALAKSHIQLNDKTELKERIDKVEGALTSTNLKVVNEKGESKEMSCKDILEKHAGAKKGLFEKAGEFIRKIALKIAILCHPEEAKKLKIKEKQQMKEARHSDSVTIKPNLPTPKPAM